MQIDNFKPAFPTVVDNHLKEYSDPGMTLRDYFAAKCMDAVIGTLNGPVTCEEYPGNFDYYASCAYKMADAMLRAREAS